MEDPTIKTTTLHPKKKKSQQPFGFVPPPSEDAIPNQLRRQRRRGEMAQMGSREGSVTGELGSDSAEMVSASGKLGSDLREEE
ncbi:hypothetical protein QJS04_geneDACA016892 [Acorus gramineus]|uniref:Uncharacterized protein n=1 Tax=Acorus gramineus TaxID=55184 RepID=A0AAV9BSD4_ACOGR|nr:hypothetical protein QJS04_geneDACA016892 [Acorus gramineus]